MQLAIALFLISFSSFAADLNLKDYNWNLTDVARLGLKKETLFSKMDRSFIKGGSICSNRAHMWAHDFKAKLNIDSGKIFLFYTKKKKTSISERTWWYHVAPVINENSSIIVMDAGFSGSLKGPVSVTEWLKYFTSSTNCKEIASSETDLIELIFKGQPFPESTRYGQFDCYYKITPHTFWTPRVVAANILGRDEDGRPIRIERDYIEPSELYQSCLEATTSKLEYALGKNREECKAYANFWPLEDVY